MEAHVAEIITTEDTRGGADMMTGSTTADPLTEVAEGGVVDRTGTSFLGGDLHRRTIAEVDIDLDPDHVPTLHVDTES